ncbi:MAG TPA: hypothetical protein VMT00_10940 [Thermoanaerobaculia bacterium]|nr:hypothetical protein [Thermoanaerobaculia bacterium]
MIRAIVRSGYVAAKRLHSAVGVDRMIDRDELHLRRTHDDLLVICLNSLHEARRPWRARCPPRQAWPEGRAGVPRPPL